jgi:hypothetical protein
MTYEMARTCTFCLATLATCGVTAVLVLFVVALHTIFYQRDMQKAADAFVMIVSKRADRNARRKSGS